MAEVRCFQCATGEIVCYCACEQVYLCSSCLKSHEGPNHLLLEDPHNIISSLDHFTPNARNGLESFTQQIDSIIQEILRISEEHRQKILETRIGPYDETELDSIINYSISIDYDYFDQIFPSRPTARNTYILDPDYNIEELNLVTMERKNTHIAMDYLINPKLFYYENFVYILGSTDLITLPNFYKIDVYERTVEIIGQISSLKSRFGCTIDKNSIYIIGGRMVNDNGWIALRTAEVFNVNDAILSTLPELNNPMFAVSTAVHDRILYAVPENSTNIEILELDGENPFITISFPTKISKSWGLVSCNENLLICNGRTIYVMVLDPAPDFVPLITVESYDSYWNDKHNPVSFNNFAYFFGHEYIIKYSTKENTYEAIYLKN
jgi:hypothetical protein